MEPIEISLQQAIDLAELAIREYGEDYVYGRDDCVYFVDGEPSCLVGQIIYRLGYKFNEEELAPEMQGEPTSVRLNHCGITRLIMTGVVKADSRTAMFLETLQENNDDRLEWGDSYNIAREEIRFACEEANHDSGEKNYVEEDAVATDIADRADHPVVV